MVCPTALFLYSVQGGAEVPMILPADANTSDTAQQQQQQQYELPPISPSHITSSDTEYVVPKEPVISDPPSEKEEEKKEANEYSSRDDGVVIPLPPPDPVNTHTQCHIMTMHLLSPQPPQPFHLNVEWNIKDIRMLLGSDLPIFGKEGHPAISLRLRYYINYFDYSAKLLHKFMLET